MAMFHYLIQVPELPESLNTSLRPVLEHGGQDTQGGGVDESADPREMLQAASSPLRQEEVRRAANLQHSVRVGISATDSLSARRALPSTRRSA
eukprot:6578511-Pyramimonas_sp.AAC.1